MAGNAGGYSLLGNVQPPPIMDHSFLEKLPNEVALLLERGELLFHVRVLWGLFSYDKESH